MIDIECPRCSHEFEIEDWSFGNCPKCDNSYWSEEDCLEDYSDCWMAIYWQDYKRKE